MTEGDWFEWVTRTYKQRLLRKAYGLVADRRDAEEIVDDALMAVWRHRARLMNESQSYLEVWMFGNDRGALLLAVRAWWRKSQRLGERFESDAVSFEEQWESQPEPVSRSDASLGEEPIWELLSLLPPPPNIERIVLFLRYAGFSHAEIAAWLGCPEGSVRNAVYRAKRRLEGGR